MAMKRPMFRRPRPMAKKRRVITRKARPVRGMLTRSVHWFKRRATATTIAGDGVVNSQFRGFNFSLSTVINASEFSALFDQYKITGIALRFYLNRNLGNNVVGDGLRPRMYIITDYDTSTAPTSFDELREYSNCRVWNFDLARPFRYWLKPKVLREVYRTAVSTGTAPAKAGWISTQFLDLQHFGIRLGIENLRDVDYSIVVEPTFYFGCKNVK